MRIETLFKALVMHTIIFTCPIPESLIVANSYPLIPNQKKKIKWQRSIFWSKSRNGKKIPHSNNAPMVKEWTFHSYTKVSSSTLKAALLFPLKQKSFSLSSLREGLSITWVVPYSELSVLWLAKMPSLPSYVCMKVEYRDWQKKQ